MIKSFKCHETELNFHGKFSRRLPKDIQRVVARKLEIISAASQLNSLRIPPSNHLEKLKRSRKGQHSIRVNDQWRICFIWKHGDAFKVEMIDYHKEKK